jgi:hypothetical protein
VLVDYVNHSVRVPVETYADGILHDPGIITVEDDVTASEGKYRLSISSMHPAPAFNSPNMNATVFNMTFKVVKRGKSTLELTESELPCDFVHLYSPYLKQPIPHWTIDGFFQTTEVCTRIQSLNVGVPVKDELLKPVIYGENTTAQVTILNDGDIADIYNLTLYHNTIPLASWQDQVLSPHANDTLSFIIPNLNIGLHTFNACASISHGAEKLFDSLMETTKVILAPTLEVVGPGSAAPGETVSFNASESIHNDPEGHIIWYRWSIWKPGETHPVDWHEGNATAGDVTFEYTIPSEVSKFGNWMVLLVVEDSFGITAEPLSGSTLLPYGELLRPATEAYRKAILLTVEKPLPSISIICPENSTYLTKDVSLIFAVNKPVFWMGYCIDGYENVTISGNTTLTSLVDGFHHITVYANDTSGSMGASNTVWFTIDATAPIINIISPENATYNTNMVELSFTVNEQTSWIGYCLNGQENVTITENKTLSVPLDGTCSIMIYANDTAGHMA